MIKFPVRGEIEEKKISLKVGINKYNYRNF